MSREFAIHFARVHLAECRARRHNPVNRAFYWFLFATAQKARRDAAAVRVVEQRDLFGMVRRG